MLAGSGVLDARPGQRRRDRVDDLHVGTRTRALRDPRERDQPDRHDAHAATAKIGGKTVDLPFIDQALNGPFVAWRCSNDASWVTGQIFGSGADRVVILEQPRYGTGIFKPGGWSLKDLQKHTKSFFGTPLEPFGLMKPPYPLFKDGVKPQPERSEAKGE